VTQGPGGGFSHSTVQSMHAYDFGLDVGTPLVAVDDGVIAHLRGDIRPGNPCYSGGGPACANTVNYVVIAHSDGTDTAYLHIAQPLVEVDRR
jgi:murein DD-endopeptidase MepM/ murein hydrolase activator NlpD